MGFNSAFISTIVACISGPWISPLINGRPCDAFQSSRGLRQGCPLSPYLFILMAESFSSALDHNRRVGLISGIKFGNGVKNINHSQFANDTLLIGGASTTIARRFKTLLNQFMEYSGGEVNFHKSCIYGWNISNQTAHSIANIFGVAYKANWDHFTYLGMPVIESKYLNGKRQRLLEIDIPNRDSTKIWHLCKKEIPFLNQNISKIPGGGDSINYATDKIMGLQPLNTIEEAIPFMHHLNCKGIQRLDQISKWDVDIGAWTNWEFPASPSTLEASLKALQKNLQNRAPIKKGATDGFRWDPTGPSYTIKSGYHYICNSTYQIPIWNHWRIIWKSEAIPKIKFFNWLLLKGKVLTSENLRKRGINGPSRCPNRCSAEETIQHLFLDCPFAKRCWINLSSLGNINWQPQQNISEAIHEWKKNCPWKDKRSKIVKRIWAIIPHNLLWRIWLTRNKKIFQNKERNVRMTCNKAHTLAQETIAAKYKGKIQAADYSVEERSVIRHILDRPGQHQETQRTDRQQQAQTREWEIRLPAQDYKMWIQSSNCPTLYFDGASKSNPGQAGAGGVILNEFGDEICSYEWSLGTKTNNNAEVLALYQGLIQLKNMGIRKALVFVDSAIIIRLMNYNQRSPNSNLQQHIERIKLLLNHFEHIKFYHILRTLNMKADKCANNAVGKQEGVLRHNNRESFQPLP
eukprot:PITA_07019